MRSFYCRLAILASALTVTVLSGCAGNAIAGKPQAASVMTSSSALPAEPEPRVPNSSWLQPSSASVVPEPISTTPTDEISTATTVSETSTAQLTSVTFDVDNGDVAFVSPSGNVVCAVIGGLARCDIDDARYDPGPPPAECANGLWGKTFYINNGEAQMGCASDDQLELAKVGQPTTRWLPEGGSTLVKRGMTVAVLDVGATVRTGTIDCYSHPTGTVCYDTTTMRSFLVSADNYEFR